MKVPCIPYWREYVLNVILFMTLGGLTERCKCYNPNATARDEVTETETDCPPSLCQQEKSNCLSSVHVNSATCHSRITVPTHGR